MIFILWKRQNMQNGPKSRSGLVDSECRACCVCGALSYTRGTPTGHSSFDTWLKEILFPSNFHETDFKTSTFR